MVDYVITRERIIILILDSILPPPPFDYPSHFKGPSDDGYPGVTAYKVKIVWVKCHI
jgi:hypothetical protein